MRVPPMRSGGRLPGQATEGPMSAARCLVLLAVLFCARTSPAQTLLFEEFGSVPYEHVGCAVAMVGDVDADGAEDFCISAIGANFSSAQFPGKGRVYSGRTRQQTSGGNPPPDDCSGTYVFHFTPSYMLGQGIQVGGQSYSQYWSRDPAGFAGTGHTNGLAFF